MANLYIELTETEWFKVRKYFNSGRTRRRPLRDYVNACVHVVETGCSWREMPEGSPPWQTSYYYFRQWRRNGEWAAMVDQLKEGRPGLIEYRPDIFRDDYKGAHWKAVPPGKKRVAGEYGAEWGSVTKTKVRYV